MIDIKVTTWLLAAALLAACSQNIPATYTAGPPDPNSVTTFTLSLTPDSLLNCWQVNPGMDRPMTMTVQNNSGELLTAGGIHYGLTRRAQRLCWRQLHQDQGGPFDLAQDAHGPHQRPALHLDGQRVLAARLLDLGVLDGLDGPVQRVAAGRQARSAGKQHVRIRLQARHQRLYESARASR